jgi:hypothetical protein
MSRSSFCATALVIPFLIPAALRASTIITPLFFYGYGGNGADPGLLSVSASPDDAPDSTQVTGSMFPTGPWSGEALWGSAYLWVPETGQVEFYGSGIADVYAWGANASITTTGAPATGNAEGWLTGTIQVPAGAELQISYDVSCSYDPNDAFSAPQYNISLSLPDNSPAPVNDDDGDDVSGSWDVVVPGGGNITLTAQIYSGMAGPYDETQGSIDITGYVITAVPEPASLVALASAAGLLMLRRPRAGHCVLRLPITT